MDRAAPRVDRDSKSDTATAPILLRSTMDQTAWDLGTKHCRVTQDRAQVKCFNKILVKYTHHNPREYILDGRIMESAIFLSPRSPPTPRTFIQSCIHHHILRSVHPSIHLSVNLFIHSFLPSFLPTCLPACLLPSLPRSLLPCLIAYLLASLLACLLACFLSSLFACLLACLLPPFLLSFLPSFLLKSHFCTIGK